VEEGVAAVAHDVMTGGCPDAGLKVSAWKGLAGACVASKKQC